MLDPSAILNLLLSEACMYNEAKPKAHRLTILHVSGRVSTRAVLHGVYAGC